MAEDGCFLVPGCCRKRLPGFELTSRSLTFPPWYGPLLSSIPDIRQLLPKKRMIKVTSSYAQAIGAQADLGAGQLTWLPAQGRAQWRLLLDPVTHIKIE